MTFELELAAWQQRAFAVLIACIPIALCVALAWASIVDLETHRTRVALLEHERSSYAALARDAPALRRAVARLQSVFGGNVMFGGRTIDAAARQMQMSVSDIVTAAGGRNVHIRSDISANGNDEVTEMHVVAAFTADIEAVRKILYKLKQARPVITPLRVALHAGAPDAATLATPTPNMLEVEIAAMGYARAP